MMWGKTEWKTEKTTRPGIVTGPCYIRLQSLENPLVVGLKHFLYAVLEYLLAILNRNASQQRRIVE